MTARALCHATSCALVALLLAGCVTHKPYDYSNFRQNQPRSILVLPPLNESASVEGTYGYMSTVTRPLAERGYYVFPVAIVDQFFKENGMPTAGEMHQVPLKKVVEIIGADAVLYVTLKDYGTKYQVIDSVPTVFAVARLVDARTGTELWSGTVFEQQHSGGSGSLIIDSIAALVSQIANASTDRAHRLSSRANTVLFVNEDHGLLYGPYHPKGADGTYRPVSGTEAAKSGPSATDAASRQSEPAATQTSAPANSER